MFPLYECEEKKLKFCSKLKILLWKNSKILSYKNSAIWIFIAIPIFACIILSTLRHIYPLVDEPTQFQKSMNASNSLIYTKQVFTKSFNNCLNIIFDRYKLFELIRKGAPRNILPEWELVYSPRNKIVGKIMENTAVNLSNDELLFTTRSFNKKVDVKQYMITSRSFAAIQFPDEYANLTDLPLQINFKISFPNEMRVREYGEDELKVQSWMTNEMYHRDKELALQYLSGLPQSNYVREGFASLQLAVTLNYIILSKQNNYPKEFLSLENYSFRRFSEREFQNDTFHKYKLFSVSLTYYLINFISLLYTNSVLSHEIRKTKHLEVAGFGMFPQTLSWIISFSFFYTVMNFIFSMSLKISLGEKYLAMFSYTSWFFLMVVLTLHSFHMMFFSFFVSSIVHDEAQILLLSIFLYVLTYIPFLMILMKINITTNRTIASLFGNNAIGHFFLKLCAYQKLEIPCSWSSLSSVPYQFLNEKEPYAVLMVIPSTFCFLIGYIYLNNLLAKPFGDRKKWYFIFIKSFWKSQKNKQFKKSYVVDQSAFSERTFKTIGAYTKDLRKTHNGKNIVKKLSIHFFMNEICVLFGSSESGARTILGMLAGTITPSDGTAIISGHNIISDSESAKRSTSICPANLEILFKHLTIQDHIKFFSMIKGVDKQHWGGEIARYLPYLTCDKDAKIYPAQLSMENKVKLAIISALCGNSKVVIIEQPSKLVDSLARNQIWNMLRQEKQYRTVIVSTNCFEEADAIGDNIGIIIDGELQSLGSPIYLKKQFGSGYNLVSISLKYTFLSSSNLFQI